MKSSNLFQMVGPAFSSIRMTSRASAFNTRAEESNETLSKPAMKVQKGYYVFTTVGGAPFYLLLAGRPSTKIEQ